MWAAPSKNRGFTIVELLIVIVIIAILAAITIVAYNGVTNRANDTAIKSDLSNFARSVYLYEADKGTYPVGGAIQNGASSSGDSTTIIGFTFKPTKASYSESDSTNLYYCTGVDSTTGQTLFRVAARSVSKKSFMYDSTSGIKDIGSVSLSWNTVCSNMNDPKTWGYGYYKATDAWWAWTN